MSSETKHTPLQITVEVLSACDGLGEYVVRVSPPPHGKTIGEVQDAVVAQRAYIEESVNARPQVEELVRLVKKAAEVAASKQNRQEAAAVVLDLVLPHLANKACEVEAALKGETDG